MDGPERLEDDARPTRRSAWLVLGVAVVVVGALGAVRFAGVLPDPAPPSRTPAPSTSLLPAPSWPQGVGTGTLYVLDAAGVAAVDEATGRVQRAPVTVNPDDVLLTAGGSGVLVWWQDGGGTPRMVTAGAPDAPTVGSVLAEGRDFFAGPAGRVWVSTEDLATDGPATWRLVGPDGTVAAERRLTGWVQGDGAGGLFALDDERVRHVDPAGTESSWVGTVGAVGPDGYEAMRCTGRRCTSFLHDAVTGTDVPIGAPTPSDEGIPALSPGNRWSASLQPTPTDDPDADPLPLVRVEAAGGGRVLRTFPGSDDDSTSLAWLSDHWLAVTGPDGLVLYDTADDQVVVPDLGLTLPRQLVARPTP